MIIPDFTILNNDGTAPAVLTFTDISVPHGVSRSWNFGGTTSPIDHTFNTAGTPLVSLTVYDGAHVAYNVDYGVKINLNPQITVLDINDSSTYFTRDVKIINTSIGLSSAFTFFDFGDGTAPFSTHDTTFFHTYLAPGTYTVDMTVIVPVTELPKYYTSKSIDINPNPISVVNFSTSSTLNNLEIHFHDLSVGDGITDWYWDFGDDTQDYVQNPVHTYDAAGTYSVLLRLNGSQDNYVIKDITIVVPVSDFSVDSSSGYSPLAVLFTNLSTDATSWSWADNGIPFSTSFEPDFSFTTGLHHISLTVNGDSYYTTTKDIEVVDAPTSSFILSPWVKRQDAPWSARRYMKALTVNDTIYMCGGNTNNTTWYNDIWTAKTIKGNYQELHWTLVNNNSNWGPRSGHGFVHFNNKLFVIGGYDGVQYFNDVWSSVDGGLNWNQDSNNAGWDPRERFTLTEFNNKLWLLGGTNTNVTGYSDVWSSSDGVNWVNDEGSLPIDPYTHQIIGVWGHASAAFNGKLWIFGGLPSVYQSTRYIMSSIDGNNWLLRAHNGPWGYDDSDPQCLISPDGKEISINNGLHSSISANDTWTSYDGQNWHQLPFSNGGFPSRTGFSLVQMKGFSYVFGGAGSDLNDLWSVASTSVANFDSDTTEVYAPGKITFIDISSGSPTSWLWDFGDGFDSTEKNPVHQYNTPGIYNVSLTTDGSYNETKNNYIDILTPIPNFSITNNNNYYPLTTAFLDLSIPSTAIVDGTPIGGIISWEWDTGDGSTYFTKNISSHTYTTAGTFDVSLTIDGSYSVDEFIYVYAPIPQFSTDDTKGYGPYQVQFVNSSLGNISTYLWDFGDSSTSSIPDATHTYLNPGIYDVSLTLDGMYTETKYSYIDVLAPVPNFSSNITSGFAPLEVQFYDLSIPLGDPDVINSWLWHFGDGSLDSTEENPIHFYVSPGFYTVRLTINGLYSVEKSRFIQVHSRTDGVLILQGDINVTGNVLVDTFGVIVPAPIGLDRIYSCPAKDYVSSNGKAPAIRCDSDIIINGIIDGIGQGFLPNEGPGANSTLFDNQFNLSNIYGANHAGIGSVENVPGGIILVEEDFLINGLNILQKSVNLPYKPLNDNIALNIIDGPALEIGVDFILDGDTISWSGSPIDSIIAEGDIIRVIYLADTARIFSGPKKTYGSYEAPTSLGSGSGETSGGSGIKLEARAGKALLNGFIDMDGESGTSTRTGGGSGGSIWVSAYYIDGTGNLTAGGGEVSYSYAGGGGGGYITLDYDNMNTFSGTQTVLGSNGGTKGIITNKKIEPFFTDKFTGKILNSKWWTVISGPVTLDNTLRMDSIYGDYRSPRIESLFELSGKNIQIDTDYVPVGSPPYSYHSAYFRLFSDDNNWVSLSKRYDNIFATYSIDGSLSQTLVHHDYRTTPTVFRLLKNDATFSFQYIDTTSLPVTVHSQVIPDFENNVFNVAYGNDVGAPGLWTSNDSGVTWVSQNIADSLNAVSVSRDGSHQIAVAASGKVYKSDDGGNTWVINSAAPNKPWWSCKTSIHGKFQYITEGRDSGTGGYIYRSDDTGFTWTKVDPVITPSMQRRWQRICMSDNGQYVSACIHNWTANSIAYSLDYGINWSYSTSPTTYNLKSIDFGTSHFVSVGELGNIFTSLDSALWTDVSSGFLTNLNSVAYGTHHLAVGDSGSIYISPDTTTWISKVSGTLDNLNSVTYGNSRYVTVGDSGTILTSSDSSTWTPRTSGTVNNLQDVAYVNSRFITVGDSGTMAVSSDSTIWVARTTGTVNNLNSIIYGSSNHYVTVGDSGTILTSSDNTNWAPKISGTINNLQDIVYGGGRYVVVGDSGTILTSADSTNWLVRDSSTVNDLQAIIYRSSHYIAVGNAGTILTSSDSTTWSRLGVPAYDWTDIICDADGKNQFATADTRTVWHSKDYGVSWAQIQGSWNTDQRWNTITTSDSGQYITITAHDTPPHDPGNGLIYRSDDYGRTFTTREPTGVPMNWNGATMAGSGLFQVVFLYGHTTILGHLWESYDYGDTWTENVSTPEIEWTQVAMSGGGNFITAVGMVPPNYYNSSIHWDNFKIFKGIVDGAETTEPVLYVDPINGSDSNDGKNLTPLQNLFVATAWAKRNSTVVLYNGTHNPTEVLNKNLTIMGANGSQALITTLNTLDTSDSNWERSCLTFRNCQGLVKNLTLSGAQEAILAQNMKDFEINTSIIQDSSTGIKIIDYSKDVRIIANTFHGTNTAINFVSQNYNPFICSNVLYDNSTGITLSDTSNFIITSNTLDSMDTGITMDSASLGAIASNNLTELVNGVIVDGNSRVGLFNNNYYASTNPTVLTAGTITDDTNFTYGPPYYKNQFLRDYNLLASSANIGAGTGKFDKIYSDRNRSRRGPSYDIGAYQYYGSVSTVGNHFVDASGDNFYNNGTNDSPFLTIDKAMLFTSSPVYISSNTDHSSQGTHLNSYFLNLKEQNIYFVDASRQIQTYTVDSHYSNIDVTKLIFVSPNGSDGTVFGGDGSDTGGNGTLGLPYRSLGRALQNSSAGNYIIVLSGEYVTFDGKNNRVIVPIEDQTGIPDGRVVFEDLFWTPLTVYPNHNIDQTSWDIIV